MSASPSWSRRAAALVALAAPIAAVVILLIKLRGHFGELVGTIALLLVTDIAVFFALTRRGAARMAGAAVAVLAAAGLIVVLATNWRGIVVFAAVIALVALFGLAARYALHEDAIPFEVVPVPAPGKAALIINLKSGGGKAERFDLADEAARARHRADRPAAAATTCSSSPSARSTTAPRSSGWPAATDRRRWWRRSPARRDVPHVCIPAGTRNHFALDLGLDRDDVVGALDAFTDGVERRIDLARVNDRVFVNNASLGVYAKVVQSDRVPRRQARDLDAHAARPARPGRRADRPASSTIPTASRSTTRRSCSCRTTPTSSRTSSARARASGSTRASSASSPPASAARRVAKLVAIELVGQVGRFPGCWILAAP